MLEEETFLSNIDPKKMKESCHFVFSSYDFVVMLHDFYQCVGQF